MNDDHFQALIIGLGVIWLFGKYWKTRDSRHLSCAIITVFLQLSRWPFDFPIKFSFALACFYCAGLVIHNRKKKKDPNAYIYALIFICSGGIFFVEAYFKYFHGVGNY